MDKQKKEEYDQRLLEARIELQKIRTKMAIEKLQNYTKRKTK